MGHWESDHVYVDRQGAGLSGRPLRYMLVSVLRGASRSSGPDGSMTVDELIASLERDGVVFPGRSSKVVSDALRWEVDRGRVVRVARGRYRFGWAPRSTMSRIERRVRAIRRHLASEPAV